MASSMVFTSKQGDVAAAMKACSGAAMGVVTVASATAPRKSEVSGHGSGGKCGAEMCCAEMCWCGVLLSIVIMA